MRFFFIYGDVTFLFGSKEFTVCVEGVHRVTDGFLYSHTFLLRFGKSKRSPMPYTYKPFAILRYAIVNCIQNLIFHHVA